MNSETIHRFSHMVIVFSMLLTFSFAEATAQVSYLIVHTVDSDGVEIASIEGAGACGVQIYDGDALIGCGIHDEETCSTPLAISPGTHTIRAIFNGIIKEKTFSFSTNEIKKIVFTFPRTTFNLDSYIYDCDLSSSISGSWSGQTSRIDSTDAHPDTAWQTNTHFEEPADCERHGYYHGEANLQFSLSGTTYNWYNYAYYSIGIYGGYWCPPETPYWASVNNADSDVYSIPSKKSNFHNWFVQYRVDGDVAFYLNESPLNGRGVLLISADNEANARVVIDEYCIVSGHSYSTCEGEGSGTFDVKMASVPYDTTGEGIVCGSLLALSTIYGAVYDESGEPIPGANVEIGEYFSSTDNDGQYIIRDIFPGDYLATVSKNGYSTINESIAVPPDSTLLKNFILHPSEDMRILSITSKYSGYSYYFDSVDFYVTYTANVDWAEHEPGIVKFTTPRGIYDVETDGATASREFNMGTEFGVCGKLKAMAISADGVSSEEKEAGFSVMSPIPYVASYRTVDIGDGFYYKNAFGFSFEFFKEGIKEGDIPEDIPLFGEKGFNLRFIPSFTSEVSNAGQAKYELDWDNKPMVDGKMAGFEYQLEPKLQITGFFSETECKWKWDGDIYISGSIERKTTPRYVLFMAGPVPVPMYARGSFKISGDFTIDVLDMDPLVLNGGLDLMPYLRGSLGAGVSEVLAVEGWIGGGANFQLQWPQPPTLKEVTLYMNGGVTVYAFLWKWEHEALRWDWSLYGSGAKSKPLSFALNNTIEPTLVSRDYLNKPGNGSFETKTKYLFQTIAGKSKSYRTAIAPLQTSVFPYSEAHTSSSGDNLYLTWLSDSVNRSSVNRTMAVFALWDGTEWSAPRAISDDGTADFHPGVLAFSNGAAAAVWEDGKNVMPDTATFDDTIQNLEISASIYNHQTMQWEGTQRLTSNAYLDRSPKIAGKTNNNVLITWISNEFNDISGSSNYPNKLWSSTWDGNSWSNPELLAEIPYNIIKYSLAYDGVAGSVAMSVDTDDDFETIEDRELFIIELNNGVWGSLTDLTNDSIADDNPLVAVDPSGNFVLTWLKGDELSSVLNFDMDAREIIMEDEYSTNLSDFKLGSSADGRLSIIWAESSEYNSDLYTIFYDPVFNVWGSPKQLAFDEETEMNLTASFYGMDTIVVVYNRKKIIEADVLRTTANGRTVKIVTPTIIDTDLYMLKYTMEKDLALEAGSLNYTAPNTETGIDGALTVMAMNTGDVAFSNIPVAFYIGDPARGGAEIGQALITDILSPGAALEVSFPWELSDTTNPHEIFAVIDPSATLDPANRLNNVASQEILKPDLAFKTVRWEWITNTLLSITARISNEGNLESGVTTVKFLNVTDNDENLHSENIGPHAPKESADINFLWNISDLQLPEYTIRIIVDDADAVNEHNEDNNETKVVIASQGCQNAHVRDAANYYNSLQDACNTANNNSILQVQDVEFGSLLINNHNSFKIEGGYDCEYSDSSGYTIINGSVTITRGMVEIENIIIQ